ncbi:GNAT family N-acetyltransferase [Staphylococcus lutrae]|uniref:GNAT family N-acetyltransferase n=1 Tax=Staphylococcus lutrae TaxID=155085 RepID=A0AAC9RU34_9STAP|nr:GNAT family N-acetyltransferase [Staphylococcus lutrae]ARJ51204.1 GNAT family N-acetyltransferase [Staphylococcus lutrae]PNZ39449.1 GNAT family N-acetyltransferase [Staphylococcus lutrae]
MAITIREISINDVEAFMTLMKQSFDESQYMLYDPGEYMPSLENVISRIEAVITSPYLTILVAESEQQLVGYLTVTTQKLHRVEHHAEISMAVLRDFQGLGIGFDLIQHCKKWCQAHGITRISLTVVTENKVAIRLYERAGFKVEGELRHTLKINGEYFNELVMSYLLND